MFKDTEQNYQCLIGEQILHLLCQLCKGIISLVQQTRYDVSNFTDKCSGLKQTSLRIICYSDLNCFIRILSNFVRQKPPEKSLCMSRSNSQNWTWNNRLFPNWERSTSRLYTIFPHRSVGKESACKVGDLGSILGGEDSPGEGKGYPLQ